MTQQDWWMRSQDGFLREDFAPETGKVIAVIAPRALMGPTGIPLVASETAGAFNLSLSSNVLLAQGEITDNETEASVGHASIVLPPEYVAGEDLTVRIPCKIVKTAAAVDNGSTVDLEVRKQASGAVGSDLCQTAAQTFAAVDTWYNKDFTVDGSGLAPGDVLNLEITSTIIDSEAGGGTLRFNMDAIKVLSTIKG